MSNNGTNAEIQQVYGKIVNVQSVAEDSLKLADFIPARHTVVIEPLPKDDASKGGIVIPEGARTDKSVGWVVAINPEDTRYALGDLVHFRPFAGAGSQLVIEGRELIVLQYTESDPGDIFGHWPKESIKPMPEKS